MTGRAVLAVILLAGSGVAQHDNQLPLRSISIHLVSTSGMACDYSIRVTLTNVSGIAATGSPTGDCEIRFSDIPVGTYHLSVSGLHLAPFDLGSIMVDSTGVSDFEVKIDSSAGRGGAASDSALVGVSELNIPSGARKEFDKANELIGKQEFAKAIQCLDRAIAIYPAYTGAYNNLAVAYSRLGDSVRESEALHKAVSINDRFAPAYVNLGRMNIRAGKFPDAEAALNKATALDPGNAKTMVLLAYVEFMNRHLDAAIATCHKAHSMPQESHALVHQVAARAFAEKRDAANAIAELWLFLKEEQTGPRAEAARKAIAALQADSH